MTRRPNKVSKSNLELNSLRARKARLSRLLNKQAATALYLIALLTVVGGVLILSTQGQGYGYFILALAAVCFMLASWAKLDLLVLIPETQDINGRLSRDVLTRLKQQDNNPKAVWKSLIGHWQGYFFTNHLLISPPRNRGHA